MNASPTTKSLTINVTWEAMYVGPKHRVLLHCSEAAGSRNRKRGRREWNLRCMHFASSAASNFCVPFSFSFTFSRPIEIDFNGMDQGKRLPLGILYLDDGKRHLPLGNFSYKKGERV